MAVNPANRDPRLNQLDLRDDDVSEDVPSSLPEQMGGGGTPPLLPGTSIFRLPTDIIQCVKTRDEVQRDEQGNPIADPRDPTKAQVVQRLSVHFDRDHPLLVVGGEHDGTPQTCLISNSPRNRARKGEPRILVSDLAYLLRESLNYKGPLTRNSEWVAALQAVQGKIFRAEHGLSAYCNPERVRYINDPADPTFVNAIQDPTGQKGCGGGPEKKRLYTSNFKLPAAQGGGWSDIAYCQFCGAKLRGFFQIERYLKRSAAMDEIEKQLPPF
jgi:hypothetical protein